ncbi:hypothetical protein ACJX0J_012479, partial [Zea mays]
ACIQIQRDGTRMRLLSIQTTIESRKNCFQKHIYIMAYVGPEVLPLPNVSENNILKAIMPQETLLCQWTASHRDNSISKFTRLAHLYCMDRPSHVNQSCAL